MESSGGKGMQETCGLLILFTGGLGKYGDTFGKRGLRRGFIVDGDLADSGWLSTLMGEVDDSRPGLTGLEGKLDKELVDFRRRLLVGVMDPGWCLISVVKNLTSCG